MDFDAWPVTVSLLMVPIATGIYIYIRKKPGEMQLSARFVFSLLLVLHFDEYKEEEERKVW